MCHSTEGVRELISSLALKNNGREGTKPFQDMGHVTLLDIVVSSLHLTFPHRTTLTSPHHTRTLTSFLISDSNFNLPLANLQSLFPTYLPFHLPLLYNLFTGIVED